MTASTTTSDQSAMPEGFQEIAEDFHALGDKDRLQLLLEFANSLPELPERYAEHPELLEPVPECQSPIFLITEVEGAGRGPPPGRSSPAPPEAPPTAACASTPAEPRAGATLGRGRPTPDPPPGRWAR